MAVHAFGFDFDHTLGTDNQIEIEAFARLVAEIGRSSGAGVDAAHARAAIARALDAYRQGGATLRSAVAKALNDTFGAMPGAVDAPDPVRRFCELAVEMVPRYVRPMPGARELLASLDAASISYAILTNGWNPLQQAKADAIGFGKPVLVSDDIGARKPAVAAFDALRDVLALPAERIWYVGDDPKVDIVGALSSGMRAVWFDGAGARYPTDIPGPTAVVRRLDDLLRCVPP